MNDFKNPPLPAKPGDESSNSGKALASLIFGLLSFCIPLVAGFLAVLFGILALRDIGKSGGRVRGQASAVAGLVLGGFGTLLSLCIVPALLLPAIQAARERVRRTESSNNLKQIGIGLHFYHDTYYTLPPSGVEWEKSDQKDEVDEQGNRKLIRKEGLSWRVRILPYIDESALYEQFDFDVPWDHPNNLALVSRMPQVFVSPKRPVNDGATIYLGVVYSRQFDRQTAVNSPYRQYLRGTAFDNGASFDAQSGMQVVRFRDITDGTANTIAVVEAANDHAVIWTKPDDWSFDPQLVRKGLGNERSEGFLALFLDGSVHRIDDAVPDDELLRLFARNDVKW